MDALKMNILAGVVRHALGFTGAALVSAGYLSADSVTPAALDQVAGVVMMAVSLILSALDKAKVAKVVAGAKTPVVPEPVTPFENPTADNQTVAVTDFKKPYRLSDRSLKNLDGVHPELVKIIKAAIVSSPEDFVVVDGVRVIEEQRQMYYGKPKRSWTLDSKHLKQKDGYSHAIDFAIIDGKVLSEDLKRYEAVADHIFETAFRIGAVGKLTWGGTWNVRDGMHIEIEPNA